MNPWIVFGITLVFNAGVAWGLLKMVAKAVEKLSSSVAALDRTVAGLDASMDARHEENLRRFARLEGSDQ